MRFVSRLRGVRLLAATILALIALPATALATQDYGLVQIRGTVTSTLQVDPIESYGIAPSKHLHSYCGSGTFSSTLTLPQMAHGTGSFHESADKSGLWFPTPLEADGVTPVPASEMICGYYMANSGYDISEEPPNGLKFLAGNPMGTGKYQSVVFFGTGPCSWFAHTIPPASSGCTGYEEQLNSGEQCWDGEHYGTGLGSADTAATFLSDSTCASGYAIPEIRFILFVKDPNAVGGCLASDLMLWGGACPTAADNSSGASAHFDYVFNWAQDPSNGQSAIGEIIAGCLDTPADAGYASSDTTCAEKQIGTTGQYSIYKEDPVTHALTTPVEGSTTVGG